MNIKINGKSEAVKTALNLNELVLAKGLIPEHIVVEHNYNIVGKEEWGNIILNENDSLEIISFVGGG